MSQLIDFLIPALLVSGAALAALRLAPAAPPGIRFALSLTGLLAWCVPWPWIDLSLIASSAPAADWVGTGGAQLSVIRQGLVASAESLAPVMPVVSWWWLAVFVPGLAWFVADLSAYAWTVRRWQRDGRAADELGQLLPIGLRDPAPRIHLVAGSSVAAAAGVLRPTIFIGDRIGDRDALRAALTHESCHARRHDPLRLILVMLIGRLYWFNPVVLTLKRQAVLAIEAGCDEECVRRLGRRQYCSTLARLVLERQTGRDLALAPSLKTPSLNLARLKLLELRPRIDGRACAAVLAVLGACIGGAGWGSTGPMDRRVGEWMEVADSSRWGYDTAPAWRRFERLANGMTRIYAPDGAAGDWADFRCDGRDYPARSDTDGSGLTFACTAVDRFTNRYVTKRTDGSGRVAYATETISPDGGTLDLTVDHAIGSGTIETRQTFSRLR